MRKIICGLMVGILLALPPVTVLAVPDDISFITANPSNTSVLLRWIISSGSTSTLVRYSTVTYPATTADGTLAYSGTAYEKNLTGLVAGTTYYFSAWGYDGADYSATAAHAVTTTTATFVPHGGEPTSLPDIVSLPGWQAPQAPDTSGFNLAPISDIISQFRTQPGGLNMPENYLWEALFIIGLVAVGIFTRVKSKNFFISFFVVIVITWWGASVKLCQWELLYVEALLAAAVFAAEKAID